MRKMLCAVCIYLLVIFFLNNVKPDNHRTLHEKDINSESNRKSILKKINYLQLLLVFLVGFRPVKEKWDRLRTVPDSRYYLPK